MGEVVHIVQRALLHAGTMIGHINFRGTFRFGIAKYAEVLLQVPTRTAIKGVA